MIETTNPEIDVEQLIRRIRNEVSQKKSEVIQSIQQSSLRHSSLPSPSLVSQPLNSSLEPAHFSKKPYYDLRDFLNYHDESFIVNAYRGVLKREPDTAGKDVFLSRLRSGNYSKIEILGRLRFSPEGRNNKVQIKGLWLPFIVQTAYRLPLLGYVISWLNFILRLPVLIKNVERFEAYTTYQMQQQQHTSIEQINYINGISGQAQRGLENLVDHINGVFGQFQKKTDGLAKNVVNHDDLDDIREQTERLSKESVTQNQFTELHRQLHTVLNTISAVNLPELTQTQQLLCNALESKADAADLVELAQTQQHLRNALESKADAADLVELAQTQQHLRNALESKADAADLVELTQTQQHLRNALESKADAADLVGIGQGLQVLDETKVGKSELTNLINHFTNLLQSNTEALHAKADQTYITRLESEIRQLWQRIQDQKLGLLDNQRRLGLLLEEARRRLPAPLDPEQLLTFSNESNHLLDALYASFEDRFRGDRAEIKQRMTVYLPTIETARVGNPNTPLVDIGCGRGEWLELLKERGLTAQGVDFNRIMINICRERGLEVIETDAIQYLRELPNNYLGAITGMHIVEHLPLTLLIVLLDEALRVLRPGGLVIFETPNPENLLVGACNFYIDPTHRNPLPPPMMEYLLEARGFVRVEIQRWQQGLRDPLQFLSNEASGATELNPLIQMMKDCYFTAPDYAVLGYKA